jgi:hypothetical protein
MNARERSSGPPPIVRRHPTRITSPIPGVRGLKNGFAGISSILQVFAHLGQFRQLFSGSYQIESSSSDGPSSDRASFANSISEAIREMWSGSSMDAINIQSITNFVGWGSNLLGLLHKSLVRFDGS